LDTPSTTTSDTRIPVRSWCDTLSPTVNFHCSFVASRCIRHPRGFWKRHRVPPQSFAARHPVPDLRVGKPNLRTATTDAVYHSPDERLWVAQPWVFLKVVIFLSVWWRIAEEQLWFSYACNQ
jgi:hypothetical protein